MKIEILGSGNGFEYNLGNTSFILWNDDESDGILMDCGYTVFGTLRDLEKSGRDVISKLSTVFISHMHDDHVGSAGIFSMFRKSALKRLNRENETTKFIGIDIRPLFDITLKGSPGLYKYDNSESYFKLINVYHGSEIPACGIIINNIMYSGDTYNSLLDTDEAKNVKLIIHEATLKDGPFHTLFDKLISAPKEVKEKTWLIHNSQNHLDSGFEKTAKENGFAGICKKGQIINLANNY